jgi:hypothetical protein
MSLARTHSLALCEDSISLCPCYTNEGIGFASEGLLVQFLLCN